MGPIKSHGIFKRNEFSPADGRRKSETFNCEEDLVCHCYTDDNGGGGRKECGGPLGAVTSPHLTDRKGIRTPDLQLQCLDYESNLDGLRKSVSSPHSPDKISADIDFDLLRAQPKPPGLLTYRTMSRLTDMVLRC